MDFLKSITDIRKRISLSNVVDFFIEIGLIPNFKKCVCGEDCRIESRGKKEEKVWRCKDRNCRKKVSVRNGTIFAKYDVRLEKIAEVLVCWINRYPTNVIHREVGICCNTIASITNDFRDMMAVSMEEKGKKIGGEGHTVEVDESAFGKRKYNRGRLRKTQWVVGGVDRTTKECFFVRVEKRDKTTLRNVLLENIKEGTFIMTDGWKGYDLKDLPFGDHGRVNHSKEFVNRNNRNIHTQRIECQWSVAKRDLRRRVGRMNPNCFEAFIVEWMWRSRCKTDIELFTDFVNAHALLYNI